MHSVTTNMVGAPAAQRLPLTLSWLRWRRDPEIFIAVGLLCAAALVGLLTVDDYGLTVDEWNADSYGPKALAWYLSGFTDRSTFTDVEDTLWYYGPWFHSLITLVQWTGVAEHWAVRHAMTFLSGLAGIALLLPIGRLAAGRWAGLAAVTLCLTCGYLYGSVFLHADRRPLPVRHDRRNAGGDADGAERVPSWPATVAAGLLTGLAIATRSSGIIAQAYLVGAMALCAIEVILAEPQARGRQVARIAAHTLAAILLGWLTAFLLWPWLQIGNPFAQFYEAFAYFAKHPASWEFPHWGHTVTTNHLPWSYVPAELAARLPLVLLILLALGLLIGLGQGVALVGASGRALAHRNWQNLKATVGEVTRARLALVVWAAVLLPMAVKNPQPCRSRSAVPTSRCKSGAHC